MTLKNNGVDYEDKLKIPVYLIAEVHCGFFYFIDKTLHTKATRKPGISKKVDVRTGQGC